MLLITIVEHVLKDLQKELQNQQGSIDSTRESLNTLCRKYPSEELAGLGSALTDLIKTYESVNQLSAKTLVSLQNCLQQQFNGEKLEKKNQFEMCNFELSLNVVINSLFFSCLLRSGSGVSSLAFRAEGDSERML